MSSPDVPRSTSPWSRRVASPWCTPTVAGVALVAAALASRGLADRWLATHWLFRYGDGLRRRALVGTAVEPLAGTVSLELVTVLGLLPLVVLGVLLVRLAVHALREDPSTATAVVVAVLLVAPSTLPFLTFELGRFDTLTLLAVVATLLALPRLGRFGPWPTAALVGAVGAVGIAVHEAFVAVHLPLLLAGTLAVWWYGERPDRLRVLLRRDLGPLLLTLVPAVLVSAWVWSAPYLEEASVGPTMRTLAEHATFEPHEDSVRIHARDLTEILDYTYGGLAEAGPALVAALLLTVLVACVPPAVLAGRVLRRRAARLVPTPLDGVFGEGRLLWLAALGPLLMVPIAIDWGRWAALAAINLAIAALWVTVLPARLPGARTGGRATARAEPARDHRDHGGRIRATWTVVAVLALLPPIGPTGGFALSNPAADLGALAGAVQRTVTGDA